MKKRELHEMILALQQRVTDLESSVLMLQPIKLPPTTQINKGAWEEADAAYRGKKDNFFNPGIEGARKAAERNLKKQLDDGTFSRRYPPRLIKDQTGHATDYRLRLSGPPPSRDDDKYSDGGSEK